MSFRLVVAPVDGSSPAMPATVASLPPRTTSFIGVRRRQGHQADHRQHEMLAHRAMHASERARGVAAEWPSRQYAQ